MITTPDVIGSGLGAIMPSQVERPADPKQEVVPAAAGWLAAFDHSLPRSFDDLTAELTPTVYASMLTDPAVASSFNSLKLSILKTGVRLRSPVKQPAWSTREAARPASPASPKALSPDQALAKEVLGFCERNVARVRESLGTSLWELLDAMAFGCKMAEVVFAVPAEGKDAGKLCWDRWKVKPNWAWRFVVDSAMNVRGFLTYSPLGGYTVYPPDKFVWLSWMPRDSDPRGTSILRGAYNAWNLKMQLWPQYYAHLMRFGSPVLDLELAANDNAQRQPLDAAGAPVPNAAPVDVTTFYQQVLALVRNGGTLVRPNGSAFNVKEPQTNGEAFSLVMDLLNREIVLGVEYQTRTTLEARNGSKADSQTSQDTKGLVAQAGGDWLATVVYRALRFLVLQNYGADAAGRFTPEPSFGDTEHQNRPEMLKALAAVGYKIGPSQEQELDQEAGMPVRDPEADAEAAGSKSPPPPALTPGAPAPTPARPDPQPRSARDAA